MVDYCKSVKMIVDDRQFSNDNIIFNHFEIKYAFLIKTVLYKILYTIESYKLITIYIYIYSYISIFFIISSNLY